MKRNDDRKEWKYMAMYSLFFEKETLYYNGVFLLCLGRLFFSPMDSKGDDDFVTRTPRIGMRDPPRCCLLLLDVGSCSCHLRF